MSDAQTYLLINESHAPDITVTWMSGAVVDMQDAHDGPFGSVWGKLPVHFKLGQSDDDSSRVFHMVDTIPEAPEALAYHTVDDKGRPVLRLGVETIRQNLQPGENLLDELTKAITHEIFETEIDPPAVLYCAVDGKSVMLSYEVCDPCQGGSFKQGSTAISNFVFPAYFDAEDSDGPYDQCGQIKTPLSCAPDGYQAWSDGTQTFGEKIPSHKKAQAEKYGRRVAAKKAA